MHFPRKSVACLAILLLSTAWAQITVPPAGLSSITSPEIYAHAAFLAADEMKGRDTPSPELTRAAQYIAAEFAQYGLSPVGANGSFLVPFRMERIALSSPNSLVVIEAGGEREFRIKEDFVPIHLSGSRQAEGPVAFAGYGITAPEFGYDDYRDLDASGKFVLLMSQEPQEKDSTSIFDGAKDTEYCKVLTKAQIAIDHGAVGLLLVRNPNNSRFRRPPNVWPELMNRPPADARPPLTLAGGQEGRLVAAYVGRDFAEYLLASSGKTLAEWQSLIDEKCQPHSFAIPDKRVRLQVSLSAEFDSAYNVAGYWPGADPVLKDELVVIGAHYDHVGARGDTVYNGADDNASGTAGLLEIAEAFASCGERPRRSILFLAFAGEEKGLFGSRSYADHPLFPLEKTVVMLNLDMIGRNDSNMVAVIGSKTSTRLTQTNRQANALVGMDLSYDWDRFFRQSDHYSFYRKHVPVLFFNTGDHPDLHRPSDDVNKLNPQKMARVGQLVFATAWLVANEEERPDFVEVSDTVPGGEQAPSRTR
ncbi:MAG: M20/M25/M40 family metallo-hydrolase [bacterium]|nr:M20/M25/M40 family metallo-hydrolase [candidate division KSB1 bacterium]MDH7560285.1 M20/M25/M40 family metallo-hydrolase [bacterium]